MNELQQDIKHQLVNATENNRQHLTGVFLPLVANAPSLAARFDEIDGVLEIDATVSAGAKVLLADFSKMRNSVKRAKDTEKKEFIAGGRVVQSIHNLIVVDQIEPMEARLKDIVNHEVIERHKLIISIGENRQKQITEILIKYNYPPAENPPTIEELGRMEKDMWFTYLAGTESTIVEIRAEEDKERLRQETEKKLEAERQKKLNDDLSNAMLSVAELKNLNIDLKAEAEYKLRRENEAEAKAKDAEHQASLAPDREKIKAWAENVKEYVNTTRPETSDGELKDLLDERIIMVNSLLTNFNNSVDYLTRLSA